MQQICNTYATIFSPQILIYAANYHISTQFSSHSWDFEAQPKWFIFIHLYIALFIQQKARQFQG